MGEEDHSSWQGAIEDWFRQHRRSGGSACGPELRGADFGDPLPGSRCGDPGPRGAVDADCSPSSSVGVRDSQPGGSGCSG